ncbi:MAG TPA: sulfatase [bacterium]|nr:sulfatase [bacterium]HOL67192.1 sulfatase [bacterium]HPP11190.1 sulfatase [bacterium]
MQKRPNILFLLIDDLGWRDLACYGSEFYETPFIDSLQEGGVTFTSAYAASPVCSPTRASIMTGKYPARLGITNYIGGRERGKLLPPANLEYLPLTEKTLPRALQEAGYKTYHVGKWHLGGGPYLPQYQGFNRNLAGCEWGAPRHGYFSPYRIPGFEDGPEGEFLTDRLTDEAIKLIKESPEPFFMYLSHYAVHAQAAAPERYVRKYQDKVKRLGLDRVKTFEEGEYFPCDHKKHLRVVRRLVQSDPVYAGMIENLDENIGRLLQTLKETGKLNHTIIIFTSDNGGLSTAEGSHTCNLPLSEGKGWMDEGGIRVNLIIRWPGVTDRKGRQVCSVPVVSTDFYPTILEMAGLPLLPQQHMDGVSLAPLLQGKEKIDRENIFFHFPHYGNQGGQPTSSLIADGYKLIEYYEDNRLKLFHLQEDIGEKNNLVEKEPTRLKQLKAMLTEMKRATAAKLPVADR